MKDVNLSRIYLHMARFYGVTNFKVFSILDEKWLYPKETKIEFYYDTTRKVNHPRLNRILQRYILNVKGFFVVVQDNRIIIHIDCSKEIGLLDFDFELCKKLITDVNQFNLCSIEQTMFSSFRININIDYYVVLIIENCSNYVLC